MQRKKTRRGAGGLTSAGHDTPLGSSTLILKSSTAEGRRTEYTWITTATAIAQTSILRKKALSALYPRRKAWRYLTCDSQSHVTWQDVTRMRLPGHGAREQKCVNPEGGDIKQASIVGYTRNVVINVEVK